VGRGVDAGPFDRVETGRSRRPTASVVVPTIGESRLRRLLDSLAAQTVAHETIVVDNGSPGTGVRDLCASYAGVEVLRLDRNEGYSRACNLAAAGADGDAVVLLNDDCVCEPQFVERIVAALDPPGGIVMAAGVMRDWRDPERIDSAGMELDRTLLVFDYLNGQPIERLDADVEDPIGPSGAAAAFDRATFLSVDGFDERLFAYWEDVDLVLRLRRAGLRCALARDARGVHEHSATLGSGSARKNYLMGFGRGYVLRKWGVLNAERAPAVIGREVVLCGGQAIIDRNLAGVLGRWHGFRAAQPTEEYPKELAGRDGASANLRRRALRRARVRRLATQQPAGAGPARGAISSLAVFHLAETSGPSRSLEAELRWLAGEGSLRIVVPGPGAASDRLSDVADIESLDYEALTFPRGVSGLAGLARGGARDVRAFRTLIARHRPDLVVAVTTMLPALLVAARSHGVPVLVYCGELFDRGPGTGPMRSVGGAALIGLTGRTATGIIACSEVVRRQFEAVDERRLWTIYPPIAPGEASGDGRAFRARNGIDPDARVVASVGYLTEGRGQDVAVRALPFVRRRFPDVRYVVAGAPFPRRQDEAFRERLERLVGELGLRDAVVFAGHVEPAADVYAAADAVVNPARFNEPFGRVPFEAAVADVPTVVTRVGAVPELLRDAESALIVPPEDPGALGEALARVLGDAALATRLVAGARRVVDEKLRPEQSMATFNRAVQAVLERRP
jgi:N-acetylglucosaminyl-diphospho-decaprenol L-rhamnosyltransferase